MVPNTRSHCRRDSERNDFPRRNRASGMAYVLYHNMQDVNGWQVWERRISSSTTQDGSQKAASMEVDT